MLKPLYFFRILSHITHNLSTTTLTYEEGFRFDYGCHDDEDFSDLTNWNFSFRHTAQKSLARLKIILNILHANPLIETFKKLRYRQQKTRVGS